MPESASIASSTASVLVLVDLQDRLADAMAHRDSVMARACLLTEAARIAGVPIVVTRQYPKGLGDLCAPVAEVVAGAEALGGSVMRVDKVTFDCFAEPEFVAAIDATGRRQLLLGGMETHICVTQTALAALNRGFDVHVVEDACCAREDRAHETACARLRGAGAVVTSGESVAYELIGRAGTPQFKELLAVVKGT